MKFFVGPHVEGPIRLGRPSWTPPDGFLGSLILRCTTGRFGMFAMPDDADLKSEYRLFAQGPTMQEAFPADRSVFASMLGVSSVTGSTMAEWLYDLFTLRSDPTGETAPKPLVPTRGLKLELILAKQRMSLPFDLGMAEAAPVIALLQNDYRKLYQDQLEGKLPEDQHRRELQRWAEKYKINNPEDVFVPSDMQKESPLPHDTTTTSSFTGTENPLSEGGLWVSGDADWGTVQKNNNAFATATDTDALARNTTTLGNDQYAQGVYTFVGTGVDHLPGTAVRKQGVADESCYLGYCGRRGSANDCSIWEVSSAFGFTLLDAGGTPTSGQTMKLDVTGSTLSLTDNGVEEATASDTTLTSGSVGIVFYSDTAVTSATIDDFEGSDGASAGTAQVRFASNLQGLGSQNTFKGNRLQ